MSQDKHHKNLESFFRNKIHSAEKSGLKQDWNEPDPDMWDRIESGLPEKREKRRFVFPWLFASLILFVASWLFFQNRSLQRELAQRNALEVAESDRAISDNQSSSKTNSNLTIAEIPHGSKNQNQNSESEKNPPSFLTFESEKDKTSLAEKTTASFTDLRSEEKQLESQKSTLKTVTLIQSKKSEKLNSTQLSDASPNASDPDFILPSDSIIAPEKNVEITPSYILVPDSKSAPIIDKSIIEIPAIPTLKTDLPDRLRIFSIPTMTPGEIFTEPVKRQQKIKFSIAYSPAYSGLKNSSAYANSPEFRGIEDLNVWSNALSVTVSKGINENLNITAGIRYGTYQYQTAYYVALPYDPLSEVEGADGNFTSDFQHSFPSPIGLVNANFGLLRLGEDEIPAQTIMDIDLHARHQLKLLEFPVGVEKKFSLNRRKIKLTSGVAAIPSIILNSSSSAHAFQSHLAAIHHRYSAFEQQADTYNHLFLAASVYAGVDYQITPEISFFLNGGYEIGLTPVLNQNNITSRTKSLRLSGGVSFQLFK
jgi:hypothetical protein